MPKLKTCSECGAGIGKNNQSGLCRACKQKIYRKRWVQKQEGKPLETLPTVKDHMDIKIDHKPERTRDLKYKFSGSCDYHQMGRDDSMDQVVELFDGTKGKDTDMDSKDFTIEMDKAAKMAETDPEVAHIIADNLMAQTLALIGYAEGIKIFYRMQRNYA